MKQESSVGAGMHEGAEANVLTSAELKRRGIAAIEDALRHGPVQLIKRNHTAAVVLSAQHYRQLQQQATRPPQPEQSALEWLLLQPNALHPRSKSEIDDDLQAERAW